MIRQWLAAALISTLPWAGCERSPVEPPAMPPPERAPAVDPVEHSLPGPVLIDARRRFG
jgi:hypothetical protein